MLDDCSESVQNKRQRVFCLLLHELGEPVEIVMLLGPLVFFEILVFIFLLLVFVLVLAKVKLLLVQVLIEIDLNELLYHLLDPILA